MLFVYAFTLSISAALVFSIQPMFTKRVLPLLGGTPAVWNTAMMFFQAALLAGYAYGHVTVRALGVRRQTVLHVGLLVVVLFMLPVAVGESWQPRPAHAHYGQLAEPQTRLELNGRPFQRYFRRGNGIGCSWAKLGLDGPRNSCRGSPRGITPQG